MQFYDPVNIVPKHSLNDDVEKWLKDKSNKITELPMGFTHFKDGKIPMQKQPVKPLDIEKYNASKMVTRTVKPKKEKPVKVPKVKKVKLPRVKAVKVPKPKRIKKLEIFSARAMLYRHNCEAFKNARLQGLKKFEAICNRHGFSPFLMYADGRGRCATCLENASNKNFPEAKRHALNRELMHLAIDLKSNKFLGVCKTHGETQFIISTSKNTKSSVNYKCRTCSSAWAMKSRKKKMESES